MRGCLTHASSRIRSRGWGLSKDSDKDKQEKETKPFSFPLGKLKVTGNLSVGKPKEVLDKDKGVE